MSLSSHSCGTYIRKPVTSLCVAQETYTVNDSNRYALKLEGVYILNVFIYRSLKLTIHINEQMRYMNVKTDML